VIFLLLYLAFKFMLAWVAGASPRIILSAGQQAYLTLLAGLILISLISIYGATNQETAWWHLGKLMEFGLFGLVISSVLTNVTTRRVLLVAFLLGLVLQAGLAGLQFVSGHDVGLWILGERDFDAATPGVAQAILDGRLVLRSYGTLPHPNVLAFFLLVGSNLSLYFALAEKKYIPRLFFSFTTILLSLGLVTALSRLALVLWLGSTAGVFWLQSRRVSLAGITAVALLTLLLAPPLASRFTSLENVDAISITRRIELADTAVGFIREAPLSGVGLGNFVPKLALETKVESVRFLQPAHNIYLLAGAEIGIIGLLFLATLVTLAAWRAYRARLWLLLLIVLELAAAGFFDHYLWSLQQGGLLWWSIIGGLFSPMVGREVTPARPPAPRSS